jgi:hypothetical protein
MKHLKTYEGLFDFFKKNKDKIIERPIPPVNQEILNDLLSTDLEDYTYKLFDCYFAAVGMKPKLDKGDANIYGDLPGVRDMRSMSPRSGIGHRKGIVLMDIGERVGDIFKIEKDINRKRLRSYGYDFILTRTSHHSIILFYAI